MICATTDAERLGAYLDGELDLTSSLDLERHLAECAECARALATQRALKSALGAADLRYPATTAERERLRQSLRRAAPAMLAERQAEGSEQSGRRVRSLRGGRDNAPWRALASIAALLAVAVVSWSVGRFGAGGPGGAPAAPAMADEVVASHVRSLLAGHPSDVVSTDRHTVKPWFDGRLDYAPEVVDLAAAGYPLAGGRLDYLGGRPVAALVYRAGAHLINVFTWPVAAAGAEPPAESVRRGYRVVHWTAGSMTFWAVSDAAPGTLHDFADRLSRATGRTAP